jgi:hypothetical protein
MGIEYHVVYKTSPQIGSRERASLCENIAFSEGELILEIRRLFARGNRPIGIYITGTNFLDEELQDFNQFRNYLGIK